MDRPRPTPLSTPPAPITSRPDQLEGQAALEKYHNRYLPPEFPPDESERFEHLNLLFDS